MEENSMARGGERQELPRMVMTPIGRIENTEGACAVALDAKYAEALRGLDGFSHVQVLWWFDGCDNAADRAVLSVEKPYTHGPDALGTFATRSPQRPNPIALTTAAVAWIDAENARIGLYYIDALDGTPVLDVKPYTPSLDRVDAPTTPGWCAHWPKDTESSGAFDWESEFNF